MATHNYKFTQNFNLDVLDSYSIGMPSWINNWITDTDINHKDSYSMITYLGDNTLGDQKSILAVVVDSSKSIQPGDTINLEFDMSTSISINDNMKGRINFQIVDSKANADNYAWSIVINNIPSQDMNEILRGRNTLSFVLTSPRDVQTYTDITFNRAIPKKNVYINNKAVKSISIAGVDVTEITIEGHDYSFSSNIDVTADEVKAHVLSHTTWATTATIADAKLKGLTVTYSKSTGITDGESITATVVYDSTVADTLNGVTTDFVVSNLVVANPDRTVTEQEVTDYIDANIAWPSSGITPTYEIKTSDYTYARQSTSGLLSAIYFHSWKNAPSPFADLTDGQSVLVTFNNDLKIDYTNGDNRIFLADTQANGYQIKGYTGPTINFKSGEKWLFEFGKAPVLYTSPVTSANLDVTKWPALHPGTKLYTPDLHMVSGTEYTFTVQADHGYTVNGGASFDVKYTPTSVSPVILFSNEDAIYKIVNDVPQQYISQKIRYGFINQVNDNSIYFGDDSGLFKLENDSLTNLSNINLQWGFMTQTSDGTIYVGTFDSGLKKLENDVLIDVDNTDVGYGFMTQTSDGTIYVGTKTNGIKKLVNNNLENYISTNVNNGFMTQVSDGTIYVSTSYNTGLHILENNSLSNINNFRANKGFMTQAENGTIYAGDNDNLYEVNGRNVTVKLAGQSFNYGFASNVTGNIIYIGNQKGTIYKFENGIQVKNISIKTQGASLREVML